MRGKYPSLVDPKTKKTLVLTDFDDNGKNEAGDIIFFDETYLKYFVKEQLEELLKLNRSTLFV